jgi:putative hydrolase
MIYIQAISIPSPGFYVYTGVMKLTCDCHIHTLSSGHAYSTILECVDAAIAQKLELIAITDHAPEMPGGPHLYYFHNIKVLPTYIKGLRVLKGVELNLNNLEGGCDLDLKEFPHIELVIASMHEPTFPKAPQAENTRAMVRAMSNKSIQVIGHPDDSRFPLDLVEIARVAADTGVLLEVNNSSLRPTAYRQGARDNYLILLEACQRFGTRIIVDSDAHWHGDVGAFDMALPLLAECGFPAELVANVSANRLLSWLKRN